MAKIPGERIPPQFGQAPVQAVDIVVENYYTKQQPSYPKTLTGMYGLMVVFEPTRATPVAGGRNEGLNFRNAVTDSEGTGNGDNGGSSGAGRKLECWHYGVGHLKRNFPKCAEEKVKEKTQKDEGGEWCIRRAENKFADGKTEVKGGQLNKMS